jgi:phosphatidylcholine synthase
VRSLTQPVTTRRTAVVASWLVHVYTAIGVVLAALIVMAAWDGQQVKALWLMLAALVIDGTDGTLARAVAVKTHVPWFDGAMLDNIVDYLTYAFAPMLLLWAGGYLGSGASATVLTVVPLVASAYQFCRVDAKTDDHFFLGFPSYWNVVAFYVIVLDLPRAVVALVLVACAVLVFVPVKYLYPSRTEAFRTPTVVLTAVWMLTYAVLLWQMPSPDAIWVSVSLGYVVYYVAVSVLLTVRHQHLTR